MTASSPSMAAWTAFAIGAWWSPRWPARQTLRGTEAPTQPTLAAAYAFGIAKNHGFLDGNKRTAWVTARLFLADNGMRLEFDPLDAIGTMEAVAEGRLGETALANWFRSHLVRDEGPP